MNLDKDVLYLRACISEMITRLQYPGAQSAVEIVQAGKVGESLLYIMDRLDRLEQQ